ncbi:MoaD/ThiS family protein [bacterium SCSIO 12741]|nr:MoaD/ThiS family protein [bacterium SCSIO 12741]
MTLTIKYYGPFVDLMKKKEEIRPLPAATTVQGIRDALISFYPQLGETAFQIAVNHEFVSEDWVVDQDAEIALFPPTQS